MSAGRVKQDYSANICTELLSFTQLRLNDFGYLISNFSSEYLQYRNFNSSSLCHDENTKEIILINYQTNVELCVPCRTFRLKVISVRRWSRRSWKNLGEQNCLGEKTGNCFFVVLYLVLFCPNRGRVVGVFSTHHSNVRAWERISVDISYPGNLNGKAFWMILKSQDFWIALGSASIDVDFFS